MFIKGKTALVTGAATGIGLEYVKALLQNGAQVSYIGCSHCHVRAMVETRLHSQDSLRGSGRFVDKQSCYLLRKYVYQRLEFVTTVVHGSTLYFRTIVANCCNVSHARFLPCHLIFTHAGIHAEDR
jgi:NAD(P)-dependent dehydrogenase (short-subunit alcohol dehydrogenase family)